jgi:hypothetical protein
MPWYKADVIFAIQCTKGPSTGPNMYQPNAGLVVTISLDFLEDKYGIYSEGGTTVFGIASQLGPTHGPEQS